jgi:beta-aspartyl-dipeptidase (metallo-type)
MFVLFLLFLVGLTATIHAKECAETPKFSPLLRLTGAKAVYRPSPLLDVDVLIASGKIIEIANKSALFGDMIEEIDVSGMIIVPGFVDMHMHLAGGGGENGFASRTPEAKLTEIVDSGITTVVGLLGTDSITRKPEDLFAKVKGLGEEGLSAYMWSGAYAVPLPTLTGDVKKDVSMVTEVIGVGEIAVSDHRSSHPSYNELVRICSDARVAGLISGKAGVCYFHMGFEPTGLNPLWELVNNSAIPRTKIVPTHMSRNNQLITEGKSWVRLGGRLDFTSGANKTFSAIMDYWREGLPLKQVSCSSDAYGSLPRFNEKGELISYTYTTPEGSLALFRQLIVEGDMPIENAVTFFTSNPAETLALADKGRLKVGGDADLVVLDPAQDYAVIYVIAKGQVLKTPKWTKNGMFEPCN